MKLIYLPPLAIGLGLFLFALSLIWPRVVGPGTIWSDEQAQERSAAGGQLHHLKHEHYAAEHPTGKNDSGGHPKHAHGHSQGKDVEQLAAELAAAKQRYADSEESLRSAQSMRTVPATWFRWTGALSMFIGVVGYFALRTEWGRRLVEG